MINVKSAFNWLGNKVVDAVLGEIDDRLNRAGARFVQRAQALSPVRTGALRAGVYYRVQDRTLVVGDTQSYSLFVEFGTRHMAPRPFIRPALNDLGRLFGADLEMEFGVRNYANPILAHPRPNVLFQTPPTLTAKQLAHVRKHLVPTSERLRKGRNVRRAKMTVRRFD